MSSLGCVLFAVVALSRAAGLESGAVIPSGALDGRGPLAAHAVTSEPVGIGHVFGGEEPDLFVATGRHGRNKGLFVYPWAGRGPHGEPVFGVRKAVGYPFDAEYPPSGHIVEMAGGAIHGLWLHDNRMGHTVWDRSAMRFEERERIRLRGLPRGARSVAALVNPDGTVELLLEVGDGVRYRAEGPSWRSPDYDPYDGRGIWRGELPYVG